MIAFTAKTVVKTSTRMPHYNVVATAGNPNRCGVNEEHARHKKIASTTQNRQTNKSNHHGYGEKLIRPTIHQRQCRAGKQ